MLSPKIVVMNGPKGSGKDAAADYMVSQMTHLQKFEFKERLIEIICSTYGLTKREWAQLVQRDYKEKPCNALWGRSPREAYVFVAEEVIKPNFGEHIFGRLTGAQAINHQISIVSDGGYKEEIEALLEFYTPEDILVVRVHRPGYEFTNEGRYYLQEEMFEHPPIIVDAHNDSDLGSYLTLLKQALSAFYGPLAKVCKTSLASRTQNMVDHVEARFFRERPWP